MRKPDLPARIEARLREHGMATARELSTELGASVAAISGRISSMKPQARVHIGGYRRDSDGGRLYPRALWAAGPGKDASKPKPLPVAQYNERHRGRQCFAVNSVFQLGIPARERPILMDGRGVGCRSPENSSSKHQHSV